MKKTIAVLLTLACLAAPSIGAAATNLSTSFQTHTVGAATNESLNAVTTGGSWTLNTGDNRTFTIVQDAAGVSAGDQALLFDDADTGGNAGTISFASLDLTLDANFVTNQVVVTTAFGLRRSGTGKSYTYEFLGTGGTVGATITWSGDPVASVSFNGGTPKAVGDLFLNPWDKDSARVRNISATFVGGNVLLAFGALNSGYIPVLNGVTNLQTLRFGHGGTSPQARGFFIDEIVVTQDPQPEVPFAIAQDISVFPNIAKDFTLAGFDPQGSNLTYNLASSPANGTLTTNVALPNLTYTPANNYVGLDSFTFTVSDGVNTSAPGTVTITVTNKVPVANAMSVTTGFEMPVGITLPGSDPDNGPSSLTYSITGFPSNGTLTTNGALPNVTYTPNTGYFGADSLAYTVNDGPATNGPATVSITVRGKGIVVMDQATINASTELSSSPVTIGLTTTNLGTATLTYPNFTLFSTYSNSPANFGASVLGTLPIHRVGVFGDTNMPAAEVSSNELITVSFNQPVVVSNLTLTTWGTNDNPVKIGGFTSDPGVPTFLAYDLAGVVFPLEVVPGHSYDSTNGILTLEMTAFVNKVFVDFENIVTFNAFTLTSCTTNNGSGGVGLEGFDYALQPYVGLISINALPPDKVVISWGSDDAGSSYSVQSKLNLINGWSTVVSNLLATPPQTAYTGTVNQVSEFYRVVLEE